MFWLRSAGLCSRISFFILLVTVLSVQSAYSQAGCSTPFTTLKQTKVASITIPGVSNMHGYIEGLPDDYATATSAKYPLLIFFHGLGEQGTGSATDLCKFFSNEWWLAPPVIFERTSLSVFPSSVTVNGQTFKFILICPQINGFSDANTNINNLITYLESTYRVDPARIYLTGLSAGADYIQDFAGYSDANAKRIAALLPVAVCSGLSSSQANVIARNNLPFWATKCTSDATCAPGTTAANNANLINNQSPATAVAAYSTTFPVAGWDCNSALPHNVWDQTYNVSFTQNVNGVTQNVYQWMLSYNRASAVLPVKLENYTIALRNNKVYADWTTSFESNNKEFTIERSADGKTFTTIGTIAAVNTTTGKSYQWIDESPLKNLSYYRLVQTDLDGKKEYFQIKKVLNRTAGDNTLIIAPNPFAGELTAFINVSRAQQVTISLADLNGRIIKTQYAKYAAGNAEINLNTTSLPGGVYLLKVQGEDFTQTQKVIKK